MCAAASSRLHDFARHACVTGTSCKRGMLLAQAFHCTVGIGHLCWHALRAISDECLALCVQSSQGLPDIASVLSGVQFIWSLHYSVQAAHLLSVQTDLEYRNSSQCMLAVCKKQLQPLGLTAAGSAHKAHLCPAESHLLLSTMSEAEEQALTPVWPGGRNSLHSHFGFGSCTGRHWLSVCGPLLLSAPQSQQAAASSSASIFAAGAGC